MGLRLLGRFALVITGSAVAVSRTGQRMLVRVALSDGAEDRCSLAGTLWPEHTESRAQANLRGAMWRLPEAVRRHLVVGTGTVAFDRSWDVDLDVAERFAWTAGLDGRGALPDASLFRHDLLPHWDEPWLLVHRERYRQFRLHALEDLARRHLDAGRPFDATDCALLAVAAEPLRESAQGLLIRGHLAAGNRAAALESYERFRWLLADELGVEPSAELTALVRELGGGSRPGRREPGGGVGTGRVPRPRR